DAHGALLQDVHLASGLSLTEEHVTRRARLAESSEELVASGHVVMGRPYAGGGDAQPRYVTRRSLLGWRRAVKIHRLGPPRSHPERWGRTSPSSSSRGVGAHLSAQGRGGGGRGARAPGEVLAEQREIVGR